MNLQGNLCCGFVFIVIADCDEDSLQGKGFRKLQKELCDYYRPFNENIINQAAEADSC